jgi:hypothetical protein
MLRTFELLVKSWEKQIVYYEGNEWLVKYATIFNKPYHKLSQKRKIEILEIALNPYRQNMENHSIICDKLRLT